MRHLGEKRVGCDELMNVVSEFVPQLLRRQRIGFRKDPLQSNGGIQDVLHSSRTSRISSTATLVVPLFRNSSRTLPARSCTRRAITGSTGRPSAALAHNDSRS